MMLGICALLKQNFQLFCLQVPDSSNSKAILPIFDKKRCKKTAMLNYIYLVSKINFTRNEKRFF